MNNLLYTRKEAAEVLRISTDTLDRLTAAKTIKKVEIGSRIFYTPESLEDFIHKLVTQGFALTY